MSQDFPCDECGKPWANRKEAIDCEETHKQHCATWDATTGLRCVVDGCKCTAAFDNDSATNGKCPHHKAAA